MGSRLTINTQNMISHLANYCFPINNNSSAAPVYDDNDACVKWCHNMTSKGNCHIELKENVMHEWVDKGAITVSHVSGKYNPADIFTKEMRDGCETLSCIEVWISSKAFIPRPFLFQMSSTSLNWCTMFRPPLLNF